MPIDYYEALEVARRFCNPWRENFARPWYSGRSMYATNGQVAIAIHDVEAFGQGNDAEQACQIADLFKQVDAERDALKRHRVDLPNLSLALRAVLRVVAERESTLGDEGFGLINGAILIEDGCVINAEYAQRVAALYYHFDDDGVFGAWVGKRNAMVLFKGKRWEVVVMPLYSVKNPGVPARPCADARTGEIVSVTEANERKSDGSDD